MGHKAKMAGLKQSSHENFISPAQSIKRARGIYDLSNFVIHNFIFLFCLALAGLGDHAFNRLSAGLSNQV